MTGRNKREIKRGENVTRKQDPRHADCNQPPHSAIAGRRSGAEAASMDGRGKERGKTRDKITSPRWKAFLVRPESDAMERAALLPLPFSSHEPEVALAWATSYNRCEISRPSGTWAIVVPMPAHKCKGKR